MHTTQGQAPARAEGRVLTRVRRLPKAQESALIDGMPWPVGAPGFIVVHGAGSGNHVAQPDQVARSQSVTDQRHCRPRPRRRLPGAVKAEAGAEFAIGIRAWENPGPASTGILRQE